MMEERQFMSYGTRTINNTAVSSLLKKVYLWMTFALIVTALTAMYVAQDSSLLMAVFSNKIAFWGIIIAELAVVFTLSARIMKMSFATAGLLFVLYSILNGITLSFIFIAFTSASIATTFFITAGMFLATSIYGYVTKRDLTSIRSIFFMALIGLIIASVVNIFLHSTMLYWIISYVGVAVFVGLTAYDTQKIKNMLQTHGAEVNDSTQKLALLGSLTLYLDFINLFIFLLRIFGNRE